MAGKLGENEVRVSKTRVSVSNDLINKVMGNDQNNSVYARPAFSRSNDILTISFTTDYHDAVEVNGSGSGNQVYFSNKKYGAHKEGMYEVVDISGRTIRIKLKKEEL